MPVYPPRSEDVYGNWKGLLGRDNSEDYFDRTKWFAILYQAHMNSNMFGLLWYANMTLQMGYGGNKSAYYSPSTTSNPQIHMNNWPITNLPANKDIDFLMFWGLNGMSATRYMELSYSAGTTPQNANSIAIEFDGTEPDTYFMAVVRSTAGGSYRVSTGITPTNYQIYKMCISVDYTGQVAKFYIDDVLVAEIDDTDAGGWPTNTLTYPGFKNGGSGDGTPWWRTPWIAALEI